MRRLAPVFAAAWTVLALPASAQEPSGEPGPPAAEAPAEGAPEAPPKRKPKPRPKAEAKPQPKPQPPAEDKAAQAPPPEMPLPAPIPSPSPGAGLGAAPFATPFAAPPVACEPGQAVQYESGQGAGPEAGKDTGKDTGKEAGKDAGKEAVKGAELWVTRSGAITIDNPLRPLTPDVTRVLQVVIGGKVATAYGPDLLSLRRGASPTVLEGTIGGAIRWDASLVNLPDTLPIHADSGQALAEFRFRACGSAPAARTLPAPKARRTTPTEAEMAAAAAKEAREAAKDAKKADPGAAKPTRRGEPRPDGSPRGPAVPLPQGAIP